MNITEKYINYYIETLTSTMTDCVIRNVSMQANAKITDEVVKEQTEKIESLTKLNNELQENIQNLKTNNQKVENDLIDDLKLKLNQKEEQTGVTTKVILHAVTEVVEQSVSTDRSISKEIKMVSKLKLLQLNTIQTDLVLSVLLNTKMERRDMFCYQRKLKLVMFL